MVTKLSESEVGVFIFC